MSTLIETLPSPKVDRRCIVVESAAGSEAPNEATSANPTATWTEDGGSGENKATGAYSLVYLSGYDQTYWCPNNLKKQSHYACNIDIVV